LWPLGVLLFPPVEGGRRRALNSISRLASNDLYKKENRFGTILLLTGQELSSTEKKGRLPRLDLQNITPHRDK